MQKCLSVYKHILKFFKNFEKIKSHAKRLVSNAVDFNLHNFSHIQGGPKKLYIFQIL